MEKEPPMKTLKLSELAKHNAVKNVTIASHIKDVISDYKTLQKEKQTDIAGKRKRSEVEPPNTSNFRQHKLIRELTEFGDRLRKDIKQCKKDELDRRLILEDIAKKTCELSQQFQEAEMAYNGVLKDRETHNEAMKVFSEEVKEYDMASKRYAKCGAALDRVRVMMEAAIRKNKCYTEFVKSLAGSNMSSSAASHALAEFIAQFETIESAKDDLTNRMNQALAKAEKSQVDVMQLKNEFIRELKFVIEGLITSHSAMEHAGIMNERYEKALNAMSADAVETMTTLARVLNSAENMVENLIKSKAVDPSYRKKTLAQQFEAIREDYLKKKAILHEYHKSRAKEDRKKACMVQAIDNDDLVADKMEIQKRRLKDLAKKRIKMALINQQEEELKKQKKMMGFVGSDPAVEEREEHYDPLEEPLAILDLEEEERLLFGKKSLPDPDDYDEDSGTEDEEEADLIAVYSGPASDSILVVESEEQVSFMMAAESDVTFKPDKQRKSGDRKESLLGRQSVLSGSSNSSDISRDRRMSSFFHD